MANLLIPGARTSTAAEKKNDDLHQPHKPTKPTGPKTKLYDPANDPVIQAAEATANMSVPGGGLDTSQDSIGKQQGIYNASNKRDWKVDHSTWGEVKRATSDHYTSMYDTFSHPYDNIIKPSVENWYQNITRTNEYTSVSPILGAAYNAVTQPVTQFSNMMDAAISYGSEIAYGNNRAYNLTNLGLNIAENLVTDGTMGAIKLGALASKVGLFSAATKAATAGKLLGAGKGLSLGGMFGRTVKGGEVGNIAAHSVADALRLKTTLRLQEAGILNHAGRLTESAIDRSVVIMGDGSVLDNKSVIDTLTKNGDHISDWQKLSTESVAMPNGQRIQVHFYRNKITEVVDYIHPDFKIKNPVNLFPKGKPQPEPTIRPPYHQY